MPGVPLRLQLSRFFGIIGHVHGDNVLVIGRQRSSVRQRLPRRHVQFRDRHHEAGVDLLLVMSVNPGFGGQPFIEGALRKLREAKDLVRNSCEIEVDGGVKLNNASAIADAGASVVVAGSFVYLEGESPEANIAALRRALLA